LCGRVALGALKIHFDIVWLEKNILTWLLTQMGGATFHLLPRLVVTWRGSFLVPSVAIYSQIWLLSFYGCWALIGRAMHIFFHSVVITSCNLRCLILVVDGGHRYAPSLLHPRFDLLVGNSSPFLAIILFLAIPS